MLTVLDLFSGIGGFSLGLERTGGFKTVAFCEIDPKARAVLAHHWPCVPRYEDVTQLHLPAGFADVICGGFPCQDVSVANTGGRRGLAGERSGLWAEYARLISEVGPRFVIVENTPGLLSLGMDRVLGDLSERGYDAEWRVIPACSVGRPTVRNRLWLVAFPMREGREGCLQYLGALGLTPTASAERRHAASRERAALVHDFGGLRADHGFSVTVERRRIHQFGNAVVPAIPELIGRAILKAEGLTA
jgi:DNA (cytosine-5)-methyltransferase 1